MARVTIFKTIFKKHKSRLFITYALFSLEMVGALLRPYFLGKAVDDLIEGSYDGLIILSLVHATWLIIGFTRQRFDARTYSSIYTSLVTKFLSRKYDADDISKLSAHSTLMRELVDFLEFDLVYVMEAAYNILGSLVLLFIYDRQVVSICLIILLPVLLISYFYGKKMQRLNKGKNDELEKQVDIISDGNYDEIKKHYSTLRRWQIKIADQESLNFGIMELLVIVVIGVSLLLTKQKILVDGVYAGELIGIYNYILKFVGGLDTIPYTVQKLSSLNDISRRVEIEAEEI